MSTRAKTASTMSRAKAKGISVVPKHTKQELLDQLGPLLDQVDAVMGKRSQYSPSVQWSTFHYGPGPWKTLTDKLRVIDQQLDELMRGKDLDQDKPGAAQAIAERFGTPPGAPLQWSRPGSCLMWMGDIPVRAVWGGLLGREDAGFFALSASHWFLSPEGSWPCEVHYILGEVRNVDALMRTKLQSSAMQLGRTTIVPLDPEGAAGVAAFLASPESEWWKAEIAKGPVDPVSVPLNIPAVQTFLFS